MFGHADVHDVRAVPEQWLPLPWVRCRGGGGVLFGQPNLLELLQLPDHVLHRRHQRVLRWVHSFHDRKLQRDADLFDLRRLPDHVLRQPQLQLLP